MIHIAYVISSVEGGGAALPVVGVVQLLRREGFDVTVLALSRRDGRSLPALEEAGIAVRVREGGETDQLAALRWLRHQFRELTPALIWTSLTRATLLGQLAAGRTPVVSWQHNAFLKPANRRLLRLLQRRSSLWVADSEQVAQLTRDRLVVEAERVLVWPLFAADPNAPRATPWHHGEPVRVGSLGRLHQAKGYDVLIDALARLRGVADLPPIEVTLAGEGAEREALAAQARSLGVDIRLSGFVAEPRNYLAGLHLYLQPSRREGLCVAAHEAMAAGLPVLASAVGELPNSIVQGTGLTVPPGDPEALAEALESLLRHPQNLAAMGKSARVRVLEQFGPDRFEAAGRTIAERLKSILRHER